MSDAWTDEEAFRLGTVAIEALREQVARLEAELAEARKDLASHNAMWEEDVEQLAAQVRSLTEALKRIARETRGDTIESTRPPTKAARIALAALGASREPQA